MKRVLCLLLTCGAALAVNAQLQPTPPSAVSATSTNQDASAIPSASAPTNSAQLVQDAAPAHNIQTRVLALEECIRLALAHNLDIQIQRYYPIIDQFNLNYYYGYYEPALTFSASKNYSDSPGGVSADQIAIPPNIRETVSIDSEIKGVLPTGLQYDLSGPWTRNTFLVQPTNGSPSYFSSPFWTSGPGITLTQPLLKNFWIDNNRWQIELNKGTLKISEEALRGQIMTSITSVKTAYFNLLYNLGNVDANATAYKLAEQLVKENLKRVEVGALAPLDEKQSESQAATSLANLHLAESQLAGAENTLKGLLTDKYSEWAQISVLPADKLVAVPQDLNLQESWRRAVTQRPEMIEAKIGIEQQHVTLKFDVNQMFPELDLIGTYGRNANQPTLGDNFGEIQDGNHSFYSYGASVTIPLGGNYTARNQYRSGKATLKQLLLKLKQTEQNILIAVDNDVATVTSDLQQVYASRDARIYAEDALAAEQKKLENGKSTSFVVLQLISTLTTARVAEVQALANYNTAIAQLALDEGNTLAANHIDLKIK